MKINKSEYEDLVRDSERFAIVSAVLNHYECVTDDLLKIICGLQVDTGSKSGPVETPDVEPVEHSNVKTFQQLYEDFLDENYEHQGEPPSESTPKNIPPNVWVAVPKGKRE